MKLSTKGKYGLRAMLDIAVHSTGDHVSLYSIAQRQNISVNYLEQVFSSLRKAGLVKSVKGAQGGYVLAENPDDIMVGTILRALEGDLSVADEEVEVVSAEATFVKCIQLNVWDRINECLNRMADSISLGSLAEEYGKMVGQEVDMYFI